MIKLLATQASELLLARQQAQTQRDAREVAIREGLETSMSAVSHNLGSRLASLPVILGRYEEEEQHYSPLRNINEDFAFLVDHAMDTINRTKEMLSKIVPQFSQFDLREMLGRILHASFGIDSEQCDLETSGEMYVVADDHLLESALVELIQNSKQLSPDPSNLRVRILAKTCSKHVQIEFMDNGKGVPEEYKTLIFEEFFTHRPGLKRSTGLGLSFVRRAIEAHGGSVKEIGKPGEGAHFVIHFPLHAPPSQVGEHA
jgi:signal transduction histidine kinase